MNRKYQHALDNNEYVQTYSTRLLILVSDFVDGGDDDMWEKRRIEIDSEQIDLILTEAIDPKRHVRYLPSKSKPSVLFSNLDFRRPSASYNQKFRIE